MSTIRGKGLNLEALVEAFCYLLFGAILFYITWTGKYLSYITPRMKPYLYGMAAVMVLWAVMAGKRLFQPKYKSRMAHCLVLLVPALLLALPHKPLEASAVKGYSPGSLPMASLGKPGGGLKAAGSNGEDLSQGGQGPDGLGDGTGAASGDGSGSQAGTVAGDQGGDGSGGQAGIAAGNQGGDGLGSQPGTVAGGQGAGQGGGGAQGGAGQGGVAQGGQGGHPLGRRLKTTPASQGASQEAGQGTQKAEEAGFALTGLNKAAKTITVSDDEYYMWLSKIYGAPSKYDGYSITLKGFVYRDPALMKGNQFALVRMLMTCCVADLTPAGPLVLYDKASTLKDGSWVTITGTLQVKEGAPVVEAHKVEKAEKPKEEYIYPIY